MEKHSVEINTPDLDVSKVDIFFRVKRYGHAFGRLRISKGGVEWMQKDDKRKAFHMNWERLDREFSKLPKKRSRSKKGRRKQ